MAKKKNEEKNKMVPNNGQNKEESMMTQNGKSNKLDKENSTANNDGQQKSQDKENVTDQELPFCWKSPLKCIINILEFLDRGKSYAHLIREGLLVDLQQLEKEMNWAYLSG